MGHERDYQPAPKKPYEVYGLTEKEVLYWRVNHNRFKEILNDDQTTIHKIENSSNNFGEFTFITTSRAGDQGRIFMTFYGLGFHEYRERWITKEWFWYQSNPYPDLQNEKIEQDKATEILNKRLEQIAPEALVDTQTERGYLFELLADLTDEDGALAELEEMESISVLFPIENEDEPDIIPPTGENLLDDESRENLPKLYANEELGLDALAQVKFFTPDAQWTWYASEFDGEEVFFGLVSGLEVELGYFSLQELKDVRGPLGLQVERDLYFKPMSLCDLQDIYGKDFLQR